MNRDETIHILRNSWGHEHDVKQAMLNAADMLEADLLFRQEVIRLRLDDARVTIHAQEVIHTPGAPNES